MSRHTKIVNNLEYAWGYDESLSEYFFQCFDSNKKDDEDDCIFSISSYNTLTPHPEAPKKLKYTNGDILTLMEKYPNIVPKAHLEAIALDLPF